MPWHVATLIVRSLLRSYSFKSFLGAWFIIPVDVGIRKESHKRRLPCVII